MSPAVVRSSLADPAFFRRALSLLRERHATHGRLEQLGLTLGDLSESVEPALCRKLAARVGSGSYRFSPVREGAAFLGGKSRRVYRAPLSDTVVLFALARVATALLDASISERVYSYRKGRSSEQSVRDLARFVRAHRAAQGDVRQRGLHVLRRDVAGYGDAIPVGDSSPLWALLDAALARAGVATDGPLATMLRAAVRPLIERRDGSVVRADRGVPMGSPLQPVICNLYLSAVDRVLERIPGAFYARFGDDLLLCHADAGVVQRASADIDAALGGLRLALNPEKRRDLFWNGAGRKPEVALSREERGTTHVEYLGTRIAFDGGLSPSLSKQRRLQQELGARIRASEALLREEPVAARVRALATVVERSLDPKDEVALDLAGEVFRLADDRRTLRELDHWLRGACARALSGRTGVRAFRSLSPRALREHGLPSFVARRDRARGGVGRGS
jgi:hypothetical protein